MSASPEKSLKNPRFLLRVIAASLLVIAVIIAAMLSSNDVSLEEDIALGAVAFADEWCYGVCARGGASSYDLSFEKVGAYCVCTDSNEKTPVSWDLFIQQSVEIRDISSISSSQKEDIIKHIERTK